jgi:hypothetical protein
MADAPTAQPDDMTGDIIMWYDKYNNGENEETADTPITQPDGTNKKMSSSYAMTNTIVKSHCATR